MKGTRREVFVASREVVQDPGLQDRVLSKLCVLDRRGLISSTKRSVPPTLLQSAASAICMGPALRAAPRPNTKAVISSSWAVRTDQFGGRGRRRA